MKKYLYHLFFSLLACGMLIACIEDYAELDKGHDVLTLKTNVAEIVLNETNHADEAITLSWTTGTNSGTGNKIAYTLDIAKAGTNFAHTYSVELGNGVYTWTRKAEELNSLLHESLGIAYGEKAELEARITATVTGVEEPQIASVLFFVTTYQPVSTTLYLIGGATPNGWDADNATQMERTDNGVFTWTGKLKGGEDFKFITTRGEFLPSYNRDATAEELKLFYRTSDEEPDEKFSVEQEGTYLVKANLLNLTITITETVANTWRFDDLYFVGSFTGWGFEPMTKDILQTNLFRYGAMFEWKDGGEFKFSATTDFGQSGLFFYAAVASAPYTSTEVVFAGEDDNKWELKQQECGKAYKIALNIAKDKEKMLMKPFEPYAALYLVGDAAPGGWDLGNATAMKVSSDDPFISTWTGALKAGELKISCDKQSDWNGAWFMPDKDGKEPAGETEHMLFVDKSDNDFKAMYTDVDINSVDLKWKITTEGTYQIIVNQLTETISILKQ